MIQSLYCDTKAGLAWGRLKLYRDLGVLAARLVREVCRNTRVVL